MKIEKGSIELYKILKETSDEVKNLMRHSQGCTNGNCYVRRIENDGEIPKGQHTNSSCQCFKEYPDSQYIAHSAVKMSKAIATVLKVLENV